jgi:hypothetical protein
MADMIRLTSYVLILMTVVLAAVLGQPHGTNDLDLKVQSVSYWLYPEKKRSDELTKVTQAQQRQLEEKSRALEKLLDGQATLFETAAVFHRLNQQPLGDGIQWVYPEWRASSDEERACLHVIVWVSTNPRGTDLLVARLQDELRQYKEHHGTVIFPDEEPGR